MKKLLITLITILFFSISYSQVYNPVVNYFKAGTPTNGVKIKTNIPFQHGLGMPTIILEGFSYGSSNTIGLTINWYVYNGNFYNSKMSSFGGYTPEVKLIEEGGKIVIFINDKKYFDRFTIRAYANGQGETSAMFQGWTVVDEAISGTIVKTVPYENRFAGNIYFPKGKWTENGNVLIGKTTQENIEYKLDVAGPVRVNEVKVNLTGADFVFEPDYNLKTLEELETFIKQNKHLPEIATALEMKANGANLGELNTKLLQKIEELTLYTIDQEKRMKELEEQNIKINELEYKLNLILKNEKSN